jgi:hypothetical protein
MMTFPEKADLLHDQIIVISFHVFLKESSFSLLFKLVKLIPKYLDKDELILVKFYNLLFISGCSST